ncbi:MAG: hypothetical protein EOP10_23575 [Proteobacteria bacterium]|nr:MAG: hypothetical protein EOP10_23575 [Pseudomonadota bacterium]
MGAKALKTLSQNELDQTFLSILVEQCSAARDEAAACTASIFTLTANYIDKPEFETLQQFYDLYFKSGGEIDDKKNSINEEVDDIIAQLEAQMERGEELSAPDEDADRKAQRLSLAAIQKRLESLITLDGGIRDQILPALASMQLEDAVRQRVDHIIGCWTRLIGHDSPDNVDALMRELAKLMASVEEANVFYRILFNEEAPAGLNERSVFLEF